MCIEGCVGGTLGDRKEGNVERMHRDEHIDRQPSGCFMFERTNKKIRTITKRGSEGKKTGQKKNEQA